MTDKKKTRKPVVKQRIYKPAKNFTPKSSDFADLDRQDDRFERIMLSVTLFLLGLIVGMVLIITARSGRTPDTSFNDGSLHVRPDVYTDDIDQLQSGDTLDALQHTRSPFKVRSL